MVKVDMATFQNVFGRVTIKFCETGEIQVHFEYVSFRGDEYQAYRAPSFFEAQELFQMCSRLLLEKQKDMIEGHEKMTPWYEIEHIENSYANWRIICNDNPNKD